MKHYSVVAVTPTSDTWIPDYLAVVGPLVDRHGGKYLARTADCERLEGSGEVPALHVIIEWPSKAAAESFYADPAYVPQLAARLAGSQSAFYSIAGKDDFAES